MSNLAVLVFDLDDTLYAELDYVKSGLKHVAENISNTLCIEKDVLYKKLLSSLKESRSEIFNRVLEEQGKFTQVMLNRCIQLYRSHRPKIALATNTVTLLDSLSKNHRLYIVTDGHKLVQERKLRALGLYNSNLIEKCFITHRYGIKHAKPSTYCFEKIAAIENTNPDEIIYIADNVKKDFIGIKPLGFHTLRVKTGQHVNVYFDEDHEAEMVIANLSELETALESYKISTNRVS